MSKEEYYDERENPEHPEHKAYYDAIIKRQSGQHSLNNDINDMFGRPMESYPNYAKEKAKSDEDLKKMGKRDMQAKAIVYWLTKNR